MADKSEFVRRNRGLLTANQDQVILTRNYKKYILKQSDTEELCRRCGKESETIQHITAACEQLATIEYTRKTYAVKHNLITEVYLMTMRWKHFHHIVIKYI